MQVRVYYNTRKKTWSIQKKFDWCTTQGTRWLVWKHADFVHLVDVQWKVSEAGRQRVLRTGRKNVHAFAEGRLIDEGKGDEWLGVALAHDSEISYNPWPGVWQLISYNPWIFDSFAGEARPRKAITSSRAAKFFPRGRAFCYVEAGEE